MHRIEYCTVSSREYGASGVLWVNPQHVTGIDDCSFQDWGSPGLFCFGVVGGIIGNGAYAWLHEADARGLLAALGVTLKRPRA